MNRRKFTQTATGALLGSLAFRESVLVGQEANAAANSGEKHLVPFELSVMLWTVFTHLPFEQRLEKVAEAGFRNVELVGEYEKWTPEDFKRVNAKRKELGINFDSTAGLKHGVCNPSDRVALLGELRQALQTMEAIDCPSMILLS